MMGEASDGAQRRRNAGRARSGCGPWRQTRQCARRHTWLGLQARQQPLRALTHIGAHIGAHTA